MLKFLIVLGGFSFINIKAQDQVVYLNGDKDYVDEIVKVENDSLIYCSFRKTYKVPLENVLGYFLTVETKENMKKGFYRREREYFEIQASHHKKPLRKEQKVDFVNEYIKRSLPEDMSALKYEPGYFINYFGDTIEAEISCLSDHIKESLFFIVNNDSVYSIVTANQVKGYFVQGEYYSSYLIDNKEDVRLYFYVRRILTGRMNLYQKISLPFYKSSYFLINKAGQDTFYKVCPNSTCMGHTDLKPMLLPNQTMGRSQLVSESVHEQNLDNSFRELMPGLIKDCQRLSNKVRSEFYRKSDIIKIVQEYNNCN